MRKNLLLLGVVMFFLSTFNSFAQTVNQAQVFTTYLETFESGKADGWTPLGGPWTVEPNAIVGTGGNWYAMTEGGYMRHSIYDAGTFENFELTADIYPVWGNKTGIIFNYQDADNFYVLEADANSKKLMLRQKVAGVFDFGDGPDPGGYDWAGPVKKWIESPEMKLRIDTVVASEWLEGDSKYNKVKITNVNGKTNVWFNDVKIFTDVETPLFTSGKIGVYTNWCLAFFDNIKVVDITTGVSTNVKAADLKIYPNPVTGGVLTLSNDGFGQNVMVNIYNMKGSLVYSKFASGQQIRINTSEIRGNSGLYILKATSDQKTYIGKFLIQ